MNQPQFFDLNSSSSTSKLAEWAHGEMDYESTVTCSSNDGHQRAGRRAMNLSVVLPGSGIEDFVWTWHSECLLTDRVLELFKGNGFTGFEVQPVKARYKRAKERPPRLWELVVTGWAGVAPAESGVKVIERCPTCGYTAYSPWTYPQKLIVPSQWDGSDFFMVWPLSGHTFVSERVEHAIHALGLCGGILTRVEELVWPSSVIPRICPGRLSYHMPEQRARELGEPLGIF